MASPVYEMGPTSGLLIHSLTSSSLSLSLLTSSALFIDALTLLGDVLLSSCEKINGLLFPVLALIELLFFVFFFFFLYSSSSASSALSAPAAAPASFSFNISCTLGAWEVPSCALLMGRELFLLV